MFPNFSKQKNKKNNSFVFHEELNQWARYGVAIQNFTKRYKAPKDETPFPIPGRVIQVSKAHRHDGDKTKLLYFVRRTKCVDIALSPDFTFLKLLPT